MNCRIDVQKYLNRQVKQVVDNLESFNDSGFALVNKAFNKENLKQIKNLNSKFKFKFLSYTAAKDNDLPASVQMNVNDDLVNHYINKYGEKSKKNTESFLNKLESQQESKEETFNQKFIFGKTNKKIEVSQDFNFDDSIKSDNLTDIRDKLFNGNLTNISANQVLRNAFHTLDLNDETKMIAKSMLATRAKIKFVNKLALSTESTYAQYDSNKREIQLNREILSTGNLYYAFESILHEVIHDMIAHSLESPKNDKQREFRNNMISEYNYFKSLSSSDFYGFTNEHEFAAEIMANSEFREHLKTLETENGVSFFQRIINHLRALFGLSVDSTNKDRVDAIVESILDISNKEYNSHVTMLNSNYIFKKEANTNKKKPQYSAEFTDKILNSKKFIKNILSNIEAVKSRSRAKKGVGTEIEDKFTEFQKLMTKLYNEDSNLALFEFADFANSEIKTVLNSLDKTIEKGKLDSDFLVRAEAYISIYSSLDDVREISTRQRDSGELTKEEYNKLNESLGKAKSNYEIFNARYVNIARDMLAEKLYPHNHKVLTQRKEHWEREYNSLQLKKSGINKKDWIESKLDNEIEDIEQKTLETTRLNLEKSSSDIGIITTLLSSEKNIDNLIIQLASSIIDGAEMDLRVYAIKARNEISYQSKEYGAKGTTNKAKFEKILDINENGEQFLASKYSVKFISEYKSEKDKAFAAQEEFGKKSKKAKEAWVTFKKWELNNIVKKFDPKTGEIISVLPKAKWLSAKYKSLSQKDKKYIEHLTKMAKDADDLTFGHKSLIFKYTDAEFVKLPSVRQTDLDRVLSGDIKNLAKDKIGDLTKIREDDTTRGELSKNDVTNSNFINKMVTIDNKERHLIPIHFRNKLDPKDQSLDLPTIFLMNLAMAKEFNVKQALESDTKLILDVIAASDVTQVDNYTKKMFKSVYSGSDEDFNEIVEKGISSNIHKKMKSMIENRIYGITEATTGKILGKDISTIANGVNKYTADVALAGNYLSSSANLLQGKIQNFIEGVGGSTFNRADLRWADKTYFKELANGGINDIGTTTNNSKLSMVIERYDLLGDFNAIKNKFEDTSRFKALFSTSTLHGMNGMAEHYIQSTLSLAVMKSIKMKDKNNNYIDINGNVTTEEKAVNFYDAHVIKDGNLEFIPNAHHTTFSRTALTDLGSLEHQSLFRKKIIDLHGQYDTKWQADIQRYWYGKLMFMFRKWLVPAYHRRWRGIQHSKINAKDLTDTQKYYDNSLQQFDEGTYTSFIRFIRTGLIPSLKELKMEVATANWNNLTDREKANIHKTLREIGMMMMMWSAASLAYMAAQDDDDNEDVMYFTAYLFQRQKTELLQYYSPEDQMRIFRSPFASLSTIEKMTNWMSQMLPWNIGDTYEQGSHKNQYKAWIKSKKLIPVLNQTERNAQDSFNFLKSISGN